MSRHEMIRRLRQSARRRDVLSKRPSSHRLAFEPLEPRLVLEAGPVVISEFMAKNDSILATAAGDHADWIEIHNGSGEAVDLAGCVMSQTSCPAKLDRAAVC